MHLVNWKARRAGGRITIYGTDIDTGDKNAKIVGVDVIEPSYQEDGNCHAVDKYGFVHILHTV